MNQRKAKLLRKIARLAGRSDNYIKNEFKRMDKSLQQGYLSYMRENLRRVEELRTSPPIPKDTIVTDIPEREERNMEQRMCQNCGNPIVKRENENNFRYKDRKFCNNTCYHEYYRTNKLGWHRSFRAKDENSTPQTT